jgi:peptidoglycan/LPS O-acetylase OafA/YrhL
VVGFHAFPLEVQGGFIGVDIFFVISGFLISTIILGSLDRGQFSFREFYARRVRRIFPALIIVLVTYFIFGWLVLLQDEYQQLGKHIASAAGFVINFVIWGEAGYFDKVAESKLLLHLWSLGVEEQYYIAWPLLLWFAWKQRLNLLNITIVIGVCSFALNISKVRIDAAAAFYSPQTRFWELLAGSVLAYMTLHRQSTFLKFKHKLEVWLDQIVYAQAPEANGKTLHNVQSVLGAVLIAIGVLVITKETPFPGWWAALPILGAVLIISAGAQA